MPVLRRLVAWFWFAVAAGISPTQVEAQSARDADEWLASLQAEVAAKIAGGAPMVVQVHVPLCDSAILRCGGGGLGDGDDPKRNLYWATTGGFVGWFNRRGSGWKQLVARRGEGDVVDIRVWRRRVAPAGAFARALRRPFDLYVVAYAWRGTAIRSAMDAYVADLHGDGAREIAIGEATLQAGGAAHIVAYVGHNGWMDVAGYDFERAAGGDRSRARKGTVAIACITEDYLADAIAAPQRVPLLMTRTLLFAGAHGFDGAIRAFAAGGSLADIRRGAIRAYARGQGKPASRVGSAFTNPSDARWKRR